MTRVEVITTTEELVPLHSGPPRDGGKGPAPPDTLDDFDAVYEYHYQNVYRAVRSVVLDPGLAEDVTQEVFIKAHRHRDRYQAQGKLLAWLHRIAVREAISSLRWWKLQSRLVGAIGLRVQIEQSGADSSLSETISHLLAELNPGTRAAIVLHHFYGYRQREIAEILSVPAGTVATRIANGLAAMRKVLAHSEELEPALRWKRRDV